MENFDYYWLNEKEFEPLMLRIIDWAQKKEVKVESMTENEIKEAIKSRINASYN